MHTVVAVELVTRFTIMQVALVVARPPDSIPIIKAMSLAVCAVEEERFVASVEKVIALVASRIPEDLTLAIFKKTELVRDGDSARDGL